MRTLHGGRPTLAASYKRQGLAASCRIGDWGWEYFFVPSVFEGSVTCRVAVQVIGVGPDPLTPQIESCTSSWMTPLSLPVFAGSSVACSPQNNWRRPIAKRSCWRPWRRSTTLCRLADPRPAGSRRSSPSLRDYVCIEVRDAGEGAKGACVDLAKLPGEAAEHGRGLYLMGQLMGSLELVPRSHGTLVRMTKRLSQQQSPEPPKAGRLAS